MKKLFSFILLLSLFLTCIPLCVTAGVDTVIPPEPKEIYFRSYLTGYATVLIPQRLQMCHMMAIYASR